MIKNKNLDRDARRRRVVSGKIDASLDAVQETVVLFDPENDLVLERADIVYQVAGDTGTAATVTIGKSDDADYYATKAHAATVALTAKGISEQMTLLQTKVPRGTAVFVARVAGAKTNTAEFVVVILYRVVDKAAA